MPCRHLAPSAIDIVFVRTRSTSTLLAGISDSGYRVHAQLGVRWRNSFSAPAAAIIGQAEIATMMAKSSASITNSQVLSLAK